MSDMYNPENVLRQLVKKIDLEEKEKEKVIKHLNKVADELDGKQRDMNIAKIAFASSGIVGTGLTIAGIAAAPFTFGASLGLSIAGIAVGVSSAGGGMATSIADRIINKNTLNNAQTVIEAYQKLVTEVVQLHDTLKNVEKKELERLLKKIKKNARSAENDRYVRILEGIKTDVSVRESGSEVSWATDGVFKRMASGGATVVSTVADFARVGSKTLRVGGIVMSVLTIPLDLHTMITNSIKIHKKTPSVTAKEIRRVAESLRMSAQLQKKEQALLDIHMTATKYDRVDWPVTKVKLMVLLLQIKGVILIAMGVLAAILDVSSSYLIRYGTVLVIVTGITCLCIEMYIEMEISLLWTSAERELDEIMKQNFSDKDKSNEEMFSSVKGIYLKFKTDVKDGVYPLQNFQDFILITFKLLLDALALGYTFNTVSSFKLIGEVSTGLISLDGGLVAKDSPVQWSDANISLFGAMIYVLSVPICMYILYMSLAEMYGRKKTKFREGVDKLIDDIRNDLQRIYGQAETHA